MKHEARILSSVLFIHWAMNWIPAASLYPVATDFIPNPRGPLLPSYLSHYKLYKPFIVVNKILRKVLSSVKWVLIFKFSNVSVREMAKCCKILCMNSCKFMDISSTHLSELAVTSLYVKDTSWIFLLAGGTPDLEFEGINWEPKADICKSV